MGDINPRNSWEEEQRAAERWRRLGVIGLVVLELMTAIAFGWIAWLAGCFR